MSPFWSAGAVAVGEGCRWLGLQVRVVRKDFGGDWLAGGDGLLNGYLVV